MPFIQAKLSVQVSNKNDLQQKLSGAVSECFSKPSAYIMSNIEENCDLWMGNKKLEKGAYLNISLLGSTTKQACNNLTSRICDILSEDFGIDGHEIYITYHPTELWGWNSMMF